MREQRAKTVIHLLTAATIAGGIKWHYSTATVNELRWILAPTTLLVEMVTGISFRFEPYFGYLSDDRTFLIAAPCAGVNFLIVCFLMLRLRKLREGQLKSLLHLLAAYGWTVAANGARIIIAVSMRGSEETGSWFDPDTSHRIEGILVYFIFLMGLYFAAEKLEVLRSGKTGAPSYLLVIVPLLTYYFVALAMPIANGAFDAAKWEHFLSVLLVPLAVAIPLGLLAAVSAGRN